MPRPRILPTIAGGLLLLVLAGCAPSHQPADAVSSDDPKPVLKTVHRMGSPEVETTLGSRLTQGTVTDVIGVQHYTFDIAFTLGAGDATRDVTNSAPGSAAVSWTAPIEIAATNTTPQRNADWSELAYLDVQGLWPADSPLCVDGASNTSAGGQYPWQRISAPNGHEYCASTLRTLGGLTGEFAVGATRTLKADRPIAITVPEADADGVVDQLKSGPQIWVVGNPLTGGCGSIGAIWASAPDLGCNYPGAGGPDPAPATATVEQALAGLKKGIRQGGLACPFAASPAALVPGLLPDSVQALDWKAGVQEPLSESPFKATTLYCLDGGMTVQAANLTGIDTEKFLANDTYAEWHEISDPTPLGAGTAYFAPDSITPESGSAYAITRFAWRSGDLLIYGKVVGSDPAKTYQWLRYHLGGMLDGLAHIGVA